jgi:hypothetical protein
MNEQNKTLKKITGWYLINQKTIKASFLVLFFGFIACFFNSFSGFLSYAIGQIIKLSNNQSVSAFLGAFFAFIFMWILNTIEKENTQKEKNVVGLQKVSIALEEYLFFLLGHLKLLESQLEYLENSKMVFCRSNPFLFVDRIDQNLILQIENE